MTPADLQEFFATQEYYDNHRLSTILNCRRKAFWHTEYQPPPTAERPEPTKGLATTVGNGARFGSCIHAGRGAYYGAWGRVSEPDRRLLSARAYEKEYVARFGTTSPEMKSNGNPQGLDKKHVFDRGLMILDDYFDRFALEDEKFRPVETELMMILKIEPETIDTNVLYPEPWYAVFRCDGVWERVSTGDLFINELKTTSSGVDRELTRLGLNRQTNGYAWAASQFSSRISGVLAEVIGVFVQQFDAKRDYFPKSRPVLDDWLWQTVRIVDEWRDLRAQYKRTGQLGLYVQNDTMCTHYGMCTFWDLCYFNSSLAETMPLNVWTPANVQEEVTL